MGLGRGGLLIIPSGRGVTVPEAMHAALVLLLFLDVPPALPDGNALVQRVLAKQRTLEDALNTYTYDVLERRQQLDGHGTPRSTKSTLYEVFYVKGAPIARKVEEMGHPLSPEAQQREDARVARKVKDSSDPTAGDRAEIRLSKILSRYDFRAVGREEVDGHTTVVMDFLPLPGKRDLAHDNVLRAVGGRVWVDEAQEQLVRAELRNTSGIKWAWGLGANVSEVRMVLGFRPFDDVWLPAEFSFSARGHILLFKGFNLLTTETYSRYRRFEVSSDEEMKTPD
jgi:hypothetical protein